MANDPVAVLIDGFVSAVVGYAVSFITPALVQTLNAVNSPWYFPTFLLVVVAISGIIDLINMASGSIFYVVGFVIGSYAVGDWLGILLVIAVTSLVLYLKSGDSR